MSDFLSQAGSHHIVADSHRYVQFCYNSPNHALDRSIHLIPDFILTNVVHVHRNVARPNEFELVVFAPGVTGVFGSVAPDTEILGKLSSGSCGAALLGALLGMPVIRVALLAARRATAAS